MQKCDKEKQSLHRQICYYCLLSESTLQNSAILSFSKLEYKCGKMSKGSFICTETKKKSDTTYIAEATAMQTRQLNKEESLRHTDQAQCTGRAGKERQMRGERVICAYGAFNCLTSLNG